ncbi:hypothetical protein, partial [Mesorhizobium sp.]|uniref:hypothetical protein n=1 Tax=Mesorhizobium sp. TaxID=1871066 RepID=UPI0025F2F920
ARQAHNLKVTGSNPVPATKPKNGPHHAGRFAFAAWHGAWCASTVCPIRQKLPISPNGFDVLGEMRRMRTLFTAYTAVIILAFCVPHPLRA